MKVGDLVRCKTAAGIIGLIVDQITVEGWNKGTCFVLCQGSSQAWPFLEKQLELVSESR